MGVIAHFNAKSVTYITPKKFLENKNDRCNGYLQTAHFRMEDSYHGKWTDINAKCKQFSSVYVKLYEKWGSGRNDGQIQAMAIDEFQRTRERSHT